PRASCRRRCRCRSRTIRWVYAYYCLRYHDKFRLLTAISMSKASSNSSQTAANRATVALVQMSCAREKHKNLDKALERVAQAASAGANIVCLQELFHGLYPCQSEDHARFDEAEPIPGPTSEALAAAARKHGVAIVGSIFERRAAGVYHNTALVFDA